VAQILRIAHPQMFADKNLKELTDFAQSEPADLSWQEAFALFVPLRGKIWL
jgi:hypothetical protein